MKRIGFVGSILLFSFSLSADPGQSFIIHCTGNCDAATASVEMAGGHTTYRYRYVNAIAATVPFERYADLMKADGIYRAYKDLVIDEPRAIEEFAFDGELKTLEVAALEAIPADWQESVMSTGIGPLFAAGQLGDGIKVAVIDSGTAPVAAFNRGGCSTSDPTVLGGENFIASAGPGEPSATSHFNGSHGTQVGTQIAGNAAFIVGSWIPAVLNHSPASVVNIGGQLALPMLGTAPCAQIYALKTFPAAGGGAPRSDIAAAMERAIELRENYNNNIPETPVSGSGTAEDPYVFDSLNIEVVNMSLGGPTLFSGFEITDQLTLKMLEVGITPVMSAGNSGHAAMTIGSPGSGFGALTAGAASLTHNERILRDLQFGLGFGALYRPANHHQMATFSSRGPAPDGRGGVDAVAGGFANFAMNAAGTSVNLVSGTSFSAPVIAGAAATLRGAAPSASALEIRNALIETADPDFLGDGSSAFDQGAGFINVAAALAALQAGSVSSDLPSGPESNSVRGNIRSLGLGAIQLGNRGFSTRIEDLMPGQVAHFSVQTDSRTAALEITFSDVEPELPPGAQNPIFGDDLFVVVQDTIISTGATLAGGFIDEDTTLVASSPGTGLVRVAVMGDWTNAGRISADMEIRAVGGRQVPAHTDRGRVQQGDLVQVQVTIPQNASQANFVLEWNQDWGAYPGDDVDLFIVDPDGNAVLQPNANNQLVHPGATLRSPERVVIEDPMAGDYTVFIRGTTVWGERGNRAQYTLRVFDQNGRALR